MILSKMAKREKLLVQITAAIVMVAVLYTFIIEPLISANNSIDREIMTGERRLSKNLRVLKNEDAIKSEYAKHEGLIQPAASDEEEIASMLGAIESLARVNKIDISNIRPDQVKVFEHYKEFAFELVAQAEIEMLVKFMYDLQNSGNLLRVRRLSLSPSPSKKNALRAVIEVIKPSITLSI